MHNLLENLRRRLLAQRTPEPLPPDIAGSCTTVP